MRDMPVRVANALYELPPNNRRGKEKLRTKQAIQ
jgi:hypothetical protein